MELFSAEVAKLKALATEWHQHPETELEGCFGIRGQVDAQTFLRVASRLRSKGYEAIPQQDRLTVSLPDQLRFTLVGFSVIQQQCRDNRMVGKNFTAIIKDRAALGGKQNEPNIDLDDYDCRVKIRREIPLADTDSRVMETLAKWPQQRKQFRLIRRWTFQAPGVKQDLSMVRSTQRTGPSQTWVRNFQDQNLLGSPPSYEIEVELDRSYFTEKTPDDAFTALIRGMGDILRGIQGCSLLTRKSKRVEVLQKYKEIAGIERFRGVAPVTLEVRNMTAEKDPGVPNIRDGYNVTDKADGLRVHLITDDKGELFLMDMAMNIQRTGLAKPECALSLLDGEFVTADKLNKQVQSVLIFDIQQAPQKKVVSDQPFEGGRFTEMEKWIKAWNSGTGPERIVKSSTFTVGLKAFFFATEEDKTSIFTMASRVLNNDSIRPYNTDGLIFTPNKLPIPDKAGTGFLEQFKWKPSEDNTVDFLVTTEKDVEVKNVDKITIGIRPDTEQTIRYKTLRLFVGSSRDPAQDDPRATLLYKQPLPGARIQQKGKPGRDKGGEQKPVLFNPKDYPDTMANVCQLETMLDPDTNEEFVRTERNNEPIRDRSIVEMRYDPLKPAGWRWIPIRVRADKTERLQRGLIARSLNSEMTAESIWNSIHNPVTVSMIRLGTEQPTVEEAEELANVGGTMIQKKYYERKAAAQDIQKVRGLRDFHNHQIKETLLQGAALREDGRSILDVAVGRASDLQRWRRAKAGFILGVDQSGENIRDPENGAYRRLLNSIVDRQRYRNALPVPPTFFVIGNSGLNLQDGSAGATPEEQNILRSILGRTPTDGPVPPLVSEAGAGRLRNGVDVMVCMFALHYFFETKQTFDGFLQNLADNLKVGGQFIGTNFDGQAVFDLLRGVEDGKSRSGVDKDSVLWEITKRQTADELPTDDSAFGMAIDVEFISIGATHREQLVPWELLTNKLASIGIELVPAEELKGMGLRHSTNMYDVSYEMAQKSGKRFVMSDPVKEQSFLNRWYVFKRTSSGLAGDVEEAEEIAEEASKTAEELAEEAESEMIREEAGEKVEEAAKMQAAEGAVTDTQAAIDAAAAQGRPAPAGIAEAVQITKSVPRSDFMVSMSPAAAAAAMAMEAGPGAAAAAAPVVRKTLVRRPAAAPGAPASAVAPGVPGAAPPARTVPIDATAVPQTAMARAAKTQEPNEIFMFFRDSALGDKLAIGDKGAARWLAPTAPFPIQDSEGTVYPSMDHYLAGMRFKLASNKPEIASAVFARDGTIHQTQIQQRLAERAAKGALSEDRDFKLINEEADRVKTELKGAQTTYGARFDEAKWATVKNATIQDALRQRLTRDARFCRIVDAALTQNKQLLYYTGPQGGSELGGVRRPDGRIDGENKIGTMIMDLAQANPQGVKKCATGAV